LRVFIDAERLAQTLIYNFVTMIAAVPLLVIALSNHQATTYKVIEVQRTAKFAGKFGQLVREALVIEHDGQRITINVRGDYHTQCVPPSRRFHDGDQIQLSSPASDGVSVNRESIRRG
jgi:hypothetical protein